jgi:translation elongation factor EF-Tu-like GTPase
VADIEVELTLLRTEAGGRRQPAGQGYRPQFYYDNGDWDASYDYAVRDVVPLGEWVLAHLTFFSPEQHRGRIFVGMPFLLREGNRVIGYGRVTALLGPAARGWEGEQRRDEVSDASQKRSGGSGDPS